MSSIMSETPLANIRVANCYQWGKRDHAAGRPLIVPVFLKVAAERDAYAAGWQIAAAQARREAASCAI
jgi:hypothetical protein